jgi:hypothetical protein
MRVINIKLDTGKTIMDAKSNKGSEGCLLNAMPIILLKSLVEHIQKIIEFKESAK